MLPPDNLIRVARAIQPLREYRFVFAGASILPLLINDPAAAPPRFTVDVDAVVDVISYGQWERLRIRLSDAGIKIKADPTGKSSLCLFYLDQLEVDIMPVKMKQPNLGCPSRMLELGFDFALPYELAEDLEIFALSAPGLLAAKLEAFSDRGARQGHMSKDLEDIITLLDCRIGLEEEVAESPMEMRYYIAGEMKRVLSHSLALDVISDTMRDLLREQKLLSLVGRLSVIT